MTATTGLTDIHMQMQKINADELLSRCNCITENPAVRVLMHWNVTASNL